VTFSSAAGHLTPPYPTSLQQTREVIVTTPWVSFPRLYTAQCRCRRGATWLQVNIVTTPGDPRPTVKALQRPLWGYHVVDMNLALSDLVKDVGREEPAYR